MLYENEVKIIAFHNGIAIIKSDYSKVLYTPTTLIFDESMDLKKYISKDVQSFLWLESDQRLIEQFEAWAKENIKDYKGRV